MAEWKKALVDTSILIPFYNQGHHKDLLLKLQGEYSIFFSAVTINEFSRGAHDPISKNIVRDLLAIMGSNVITPSLDHWIECGEISEQILKKTKRTKEKIFMLQNDILIGLGARDIKAKLITADKKDFGLLEEYLKVFIDFW